MSVYLTNNYYTFIGYKLENEEFVGMTYNFSSEINYKLINYHYFNYLFLLMYQYYNFKIESFSKNGCFHSMLIVTIIYLLLLIV